MATEPYIPKRPFLPNGCGAGRTTHIVPDTAGQVRFKNCCDVHDLGYYCGGGPLTKFLIDLDLANCMGDQWVHSALDVNAPVWRRVLRLLGGAVFPPVYLIAVTALGWTPLTWSYRRREPPTEEELQALVDAGVDHKQLAALARALRRKKAGEIAPPGP